MCVGGMESIVFRCCVYVLYQRHPAGNHAALTSALCGYQTAQQMIVAIVHLVRKRINIHPGIIEGKKTACLVYGVYVAVYSLVFKCFIVAFT